MKKIACIITLMMSCVVFSQDLSMQNGTFNRCAPDRFFDSGGEFGNYGLDENLVTTICPQNAGEFIILDFTAFDTQQGINGDTMNIYDGDDTAAPLIGSYIGPIGPFVASASDTNMSGCLTVEFISSDSGSSAGWEANILCALPCQTITASIDTTNPAPNGTGVITILPGETVNFSGSATFSVDGTNASYIWNFGDGNMANGTDVSNSFLNPGTYTVRFLVSDDNPQGCSDVAEIIVFVLGDNVVVDQDSFTPEQLIEDVLVNSPCASVSNIISSTGTDFSSTEPNGIGYFVSNGQSFPFEDGLLLTSGDASRAGGPNVFLGDGTVGVWPGDADLDAATGINSNNASFIQFDFTPLTDNISFEFLMASEEYDMGNFECQFSDAFAFLLTDSNGVTTNLAVLPGTNTPILVTNIHPDNGACGAANPQFFGEYIPDGGPPISFDGRTAVFTAQSTVVPGENYTIKLVIADDGDGNFDSGVFLKAGSFDLGGDLGDDITIEAGTAECGGNSITLDTGIPTASHMWFFEGTEIVGETGSTIDVSDAGTYAVDIVFAGVCQSSDSILVEFRDSPTADPAQDLIGCSGTGFAEFDLSENDTNILGAQDPADFVVSYHLSEQDAIDNVGALPINYTNTTNPQTIWARMADNTQVCFDTVSFELSASTQPTINPVANLELCDDAVNDGFEEFDLSVQTAGILGAQSDTEFAVSYHLSFSDADAGVGALPDLYTNVNNPEPIFVRVESIADSNCYNASGTAVFDLIVNTRALANTPEDMEVCDDLSNDGIATFDLSTQEADILGTQDPTIYNVSFHDTQADAENNVGALPTNYTNTEPNTETIFVRVEDPAYPDCYGTTSFDLIVNPLPTLFPVTPLQVCDDDTDGFVGFPLSSKEAELLNGQTGIAVSFHETFAEADTNTAEIFDGYINTTMTNQTIFVRLENTITSCYTLNTLELEVLENPVANVTTALESCDDDADGLTEFDLSQRDAEVAGAQTGMVVTYHLTENDAMTDTGALPTLYTNTTAGAQLIYTRIEDTATGCYDTGTLQLIVNPLPTTVTVSPYQLCDDNATGDQQEQFDLTTKDAEILNGQVNVDVAYYENQMDADMGMNAIVGLYTNTGNPQEIIAVLTNTNTNCSSQVTFDLVVNPLPALVVPTPLEVCDDGTPDGITEIDLSLKNTEVSGNNPGYSVSYYLTQVDADAEMNPLPIPYTNISNPQIVFVRVEDIATGCYDTTTLELVVEQAPIAFTPQPLRYCDPDNDGTGLFTLTDAENEITGGAGGLTVTYHETLVNAENNVNAIDTSVDYVNIVDDMQTLYVRVESATIATDCSTLVELELIVEPTPQIIEPTPFEQCDDATADGFVTFDLTLKAPEVLNGQDPMQYTVSYYETEGNANTGNNPIANPNAYTNTDDFNQVIWIRVEDPNTVEGCYKVEPLELIVNPLPALVQPTPLELCDDLGEVPGDEITVFDLTVKDTEITGGNASWSVAYYETDADAQAQTNAIPDPTQYTNTSVNGLPPNPQTLYVVVTDTDTGCIDFATLTIRVLPNPTPTGSDQIPDLELCDDINTGDGVELFDLTENEVLILNGETGVTATYHETPEDADSGINAIPDPTQYTNASMPEQEIYVRVTDDATGCYALVDFTIRVNPLPDVVAVTDFIQCELNTDGFDSFDLTSKDDEVLGDQDPAQFIVTYHDTLADAESGTNALLSPYTNTTNPQEIYVTITDNTTGCSISTQRFNLRVDEDAQANPDMEVILYEECDDNMETDGDSGNDSVQFDLSTQDAQVLDGQNPTDYMVTYYATEEDANLNVNPLPNLYENITNPQEIYARVDNNTLTVIPIALDLGALGTGLDLDNDGTIDTYDTDGDGVFDLVDVDADGISDAIDTNADGLIDFVDVDGDGQGDPVDLDNNGTFDNQQDGSICFAVAPLTLQVNPLPNFNLDDSYILCIDTNGTEILDPLVLDTGLSETDYSFEWSYNGAILPAETGATLMPTQGGSYSVTVTDTSTSTVTSCMNMDTTEVVESAPPMLTAEVVTQAFGTNNVIEAVATGIGEYEYNLNGGPWQDSGTFTGVSQGNHEITARDKNGCGFTTVEVFVLDYPKYFTPNGDGNNDTWNIEGIGSSAKIYIFDRYGKLLKQLSPNGPGWNGTFNGNRMPTSDYWFTVEYDEPLSDQRKQFRAHFTLKR